MRNLLKQKRLNKLTTKTLGTVFIEHWKTKHNLKGKNGNVICPCGCGKRLSQIYKDEYLSKFEEEVFSDD